MRWQRILAVIAALGAGPALAGQVVGNSYVGARYGALTIVPPAGAWRIVDQEGSAGSEAGGPVVHLQMAQAIGGAYPVVQVSAVRKTEAAVTAAFILDTSREAMIQRGGVPGPVEVGAADGRQVHSYRARIPVRGQAAEAVYVLLEGAGSFFVLQMVVPVVDYDEARARLDQLLTTLRY